MDHNQQGGGQHRRNFHRGRRGSDRRGQDRRQHNPQPQQQQQSPEQERPHRSGGEHVDVEQIMRDIRARIAQRHGIELSNPQIQELAARRLEAILDPRTVSPTLLDQLRKNAGSSARVDIGRAPAPAYTFDDTTLFETHRGLLRFLRKLLKPILKLFFNPDPLVQALNTQARLNVEIAAREAERDRVQAEWNALHYELLQRVVTEAARISIEIQALSLKVESLATKVDFNERRVRGIEGTLQQQPPQRPPRPERERFERAERQDRQERSERPEPAAAAAPAEGPLPAQGQAAGPATTEGAVTPEGQQRRRRRRRRGRRGGNAFGDSTTAAPGAAAVDAEPDVDGADGDEGPDDDAADGPEAADTVETVVAPEPSPSPEPFVAEPIAVIEAQPMPDPEPAPLPQSPPDEPAKE